LDLAALAGIDRLRALGGRPDRRPSLCRSICTLQIAAQRHPRRRNRPDRAKPPANHFRFSVSPVHTIAISSFMKTPGEVLRGESVELTVSEHANPNGMGPYEELLHEALLGVSARFARQDYVEEAWRIIEPVLDDSTPIEQYEPGSWGPPAADQAVAPPGGWLNPIGRGPS
jgi:glucose-6-phosphate 1-dehydrogenase